MKLLAWDTSSKNAAIVALEWDPKAKIGWAGVKLVSEWTLSVDLTHSERLLWGIHQVCEAARWTIDEIDLFGVGVGPGSFTGLRIGMTTARTLAHTLKKPLIGVSSLAALARPAALIVGEHARKRTVLVTVTDASKGELFALVGSAKSVAGCVLKTSALWARGVEEDVLTPDQIVRLVKRKMLEGKGSVAWTAVGEGRDRYPDLWKKLPAAKELKGVGPFPNQVQGRYLGQLVWEAYQGGLAREALGVHPRYLRASDAELKHKAGLLPPGPTRGHA